MNPIYKDPRLDEILADRDQIMAAYKPTLTKYYEQAKRMLDLQIEYVLRKFTASGSAVADETLLCTISARSDLSAIDAAFEKLPEKCRVVYDPERYVFHVFAHV